MQPTGRHLIRVAATVSASTVVAGLLTVSGGAAYAASPDIVISQVYGGGGNTGAQYTNDFIELYNRSTSAVSVAGWTVQYASATGSTWSKTALSGSIAPGRYYLVKEAGGTTGSALPTPEATGTIVMSATSAKVALVTSGTSRATGHGDRGRRCR
jgi:predicted extracellular nuclease